jgi:hypothetical protein
VVRPRSCRVIYYCDTPALGIRHQLFDRVTLLIDEIVRLDDNIKAQVMKALFKKIQQYIKKNKEKYAFQANKRQKRVVLN